MYKVNQKSILCIIGCFGLGMPLLFGFVLSWLAPFRLAAIILILVASFFNNRYPDRIGIEDEQLWVKLYLVNEWLTYPLADVKITQEKGYIKITTNKGKQAFRIGMEHLSLRFYDEIKTYMVKNNE